MTSLEIYGVYVITIMFLKIQMRKIINDCKQAILHNDTSA